MADETVKRLLVKLGISTADWKTAVNDIKTQLNAVNEQAKKDAAQMKATQKEQIDLTRQQITDQKRLTSEAKTLEAVDHAKAVWQKQQQAAIQTAITQRKLETEEVKKQATIQTAAVKMAQEQLRLDQQRFKLFSQQQSLLQKQTKSQQSAGGSGLLGGLGGFAATLAGGGLIGSIAGGALLGTGFGQAIDLGISKIKELMQSIEEATGPAQQFRLEFERLAALKGVDPSVMIEKLRTSTRGLVSDVDLFKMANNFLKSGMNVSSDQMMKLIENTVNLGRSMGKTGTEISKALELAFLNPQRGMMMLARTTGIGVEKFRQSIAGLPHSIDPAVRATIMFNTVLAEEEKMLRKVGVPITTLPELFTQLHNTEKNFIDSMAEGILKTGAFGKTIESLSKWLLDLSPKIQAFAESVGEKIGGGIVVLTGYVKYLGAGFKLLWTTVSGLIGMLNNLSNPVKNVSSAFTLNRKPVDEFRVAMGSVALVLEKLTYTFNKTSIAMGLFFDLMENRNKGTDYLQGHIDRAGAQLSNLENKHQRDTQEITDYIVGRTDKKPLGASNTKDKLDANVAEQNRIKDLNAKLDEARAKIVLDLAKQNIAEETEATKRAYDSNLLSLKDYTAREEALKKQQLAVTLGEIEQEKQAKIHLKQSKGTVEVGGQSINVTNAVEEAKAIQLLEDETREKRITAITATQKEIDALHDKESADALVARRTFQEEINAIEKGGVQERIQILESEFKEGLVGADDYLSRKRNLTDEEEQITVAGLNRIRALHLDNASELATIDKQISAAHILNVKQQTQIDLTQDEVKLKSLELRYKLQTAPIQSRINLAKGDVTGRSIGQEESGQQELLNAAREQLDRLQHQVPTQAGDAMERWKESVIKTKIEIQALSEELRKLHDTAGPLGGIFGSISGLAGAIPRSKTASGISELFGNMQSSMQSLSVFGQANQAYKDKSDANKKAGIDPGPSNIVSALGDSFKGLFDASKSASERLGAFGKDLTGVISGVMGMVKGVTSGKTGGEGALGGAMSGAQFGSAFGPWGTLIGAGVGGTMGGIFGSKEKQLNQDIHKVTTQLQSIVSDLQAGTISLSQAIADLRQERQQAISLLSQDPKGGKGGGKGGKKGFSPSQAQAVIQQIDSQIQSLVNQQTQILQNLTTSLMQLSNPIQFQDYLQSLDQIIQKYQEFASAAQGNAQMVSEANQYLNDSLNQYVTTLSQNLNQAQQQAIQDALTLINLEYQRQQIINQEAQQEYDVLTQGVLTRQRTTAMTKGQEIGQLRYQRDMQLEQINEQISLQQYKVTTEQTIFGLATTRIGLETQLLEAQESQAQYQIEQVQALAQVVAALTSGLTGGALMSQITSLMSTGAMPTESGIMYTLLQMLGLAGNVPAGVTGGQYGITNWLAAIPSTDASAAQFVASLDPNFVNMILGQQYQAAAADASQYIQQGEVEGFDMTGLVSWLNSMPSMAKGGPVEDTGPILAHKGEYVLSNPIVQALNSLTSIASPKVQAPVSTSGLHVHQALYDITQKRTGLEMTVISARNSQLQLEMKHLAALTETLNAINDSGSGNNGQTGLEDMLQKVYENRGRYGSANFRRETL